MNRSIPSRLLLLVAGCAAGLVFGEILVRALGAAPRVGFFEKEQFRIASNPLIGWEPIPNEASRSTAGEHRWSETQHNSLGFRDYEHSLGKEPGVYRILILGDSITKGLGIPDPNQTFAAIVESELTAGGRRAEVLNFGVEGYNTQQEVETLKDQGIAYRPDLVVLAYCLNDRDWPAHHLYRELLEQEASEGRPAAARVPAVLRRSALWLFLRYRVLGDWLASRGAQEARVQALFDLVQRDTVEEYFGVLAGLQERHGFDVMVTVFPYLDDLGNYRHHEQDLWAERLSSRHGFFHLDLLNPFRDCERRAGQTIAFDDVHPNQIGHLCAGRAIARFIGTQILAAKAP